MCADYMKIKNTFFLKNISMSLQNLLQCIWIKYLKVIKSKLNEIGKSRYNFLWENYHSWITSVKGDKHKAFCKLCHSK